MKKIEQEKIKHFYNEVISLYPREVKEFYWGKDVSDFIDIIINSLPENEEQEIVSIICRNNESIVLSKPMFDFLFTEGELCNFNSPIGRRYEHNSYIFIEFIKSPIIIIKNNLDRNGIVPITKKETEDGLTKIESCFFIKGEIPTEDYYDYPIEIIPFFISQMKARLIKKVDKLPSYFIDHFEPMKYVLRIKNEQKNLLIKLLYKFATNLGIIENEIIYDNDTSTEINQEIKSILDDDGNINITNDSDQNLNSLKFYISAIKNPNPFYRFLDAYHVLESLFYEYFYNYVKNLNNNRSKDELYDEIRKHINEDQMLKLVLVNCLDNQDTIKKIKEDLINKGIQDLSKIINKNYDIINWSENESEKFALKLSDLIYSFRNAIVHSKKSDYHIEKIEEFKDFIPKFIDLTNIVLELAKRILDKNIEKW
ncbi:MAG: hypothetical protein WHS65_01745 [Melioribacteraceae bacterium]